MKLYPCGRKQLKLAAVVMTIVLFYVYFKRWLSVDEIRGASVTENYRVRKIDDQLDSGIHVGYIKEVLMTSKTTKEQIFLHCRFKTLTRIRT